MSEKENMSSFSLSMKIEIRDSVFKYRIYRNTDSDLSVYKQNLKSSFRITDKFKLY